MKKTAVVFTTSMFLLSLNFYCDAFSRSFSSGSKSSSRSSSRSSSFSKPSYSSLSKSYSSPSPSKSVSPSPAKKSPSASSVDSKTASKFSFFKAKEAKPLYTRPIVSEPKVQEVKRQTFYKTYYTNPTNPQYSHTVHHYYRDSYNPYFMLWLMDRSLDDRAMWAYHHRNDMDRERYQEMLTKDANLEKRIKELEEKGIKKDPNYKPEGVDNDLMYKSNDEVEKDKLREEARAKEEAKAKEEKEEKTNWFMWGGIISLLVVFWVFVLRKAV